VDWLTKIENSDSSDDFPALLKSASFSDRETSLLTELVGSIDSVDEFRRRMPRYKELEKLLQSDHLGDLRRIENQETYKRNIALFDEAFNSKDVSKVNRLTAADVLGGPIMGEYFAVIRGLLIYYLRVINDEILLTSVGIVTK
jgi:hypothetical protein